MDNHPGTFNVQTPPQVVTISLDPVVLAALVGIQTTLGEILVEVRASGQLFRDAQASKMQLDAFTQDMVSRMAPGSATAVQDASGWGEMATDHIAALNALTGPNNASVLSSDQNASPDAVYQGMTPAEVYKAIEANWVMNESGNPVYRNQDGTLRDLSQVEANAVRAQLAKSKARK